MSFFSAFARTNIARRFPLHRGLFPCLEAQVSAGSSGTPFGKPRPDLTHSARFFSSNFSKDILRPRNFISNRIPPGNDANRVGVRGFSTRNISGRLFYRRRPKMVPRYKPKKRRSCWLEGSPQKRGIVVTVRVVTPRKPNSGLRKVARVRLSTGRTVTCHVPGQGHNLHTHSVVLVRGGRCQDVSGCHYTLVRGKYDLLPVKNRASSRSKYGVKIPENHRAKTSLNKQDFRITTQLDREIFNEVTSKFWFNLDGTPFEGSVSKDEHVPVDIFTFNTRWRNILSKSQS